MLERIDSYNAKGRVLKAIYIEDSNAAIVFEDGTYVGLEIENGYYGDRCLEQCDIGRSEFSEKGLIAAGFYTKQELDEINAKERIESERRQEAEERARYERLKAKFEGGEQS